MTVSRDVPPLPSSKAPVTANPFGKFGSMIPIPNLSGGDAGAATSGGIGSQGNIGALTFGAVNFKSSSWLNYVVIGGAILIGVVLWKKL